MQKQEGEGLAEGRGGGKWKPKGVCECVKENATFSHAFNCFLNGEIIFDFVMNKMIFPTHPSPTHRPTQRDASFSIVWWAQYLECITSHTHNMGGLIISLLFY
jgi:hypothetical protein